MLERAVVCCAPMEWVGVWSEPMVTTAVFGCVVGLVVGGKLGRSLVTVAVGESFCVVGLISHPVLEEDCVLVCAP